MSAGFFNLKKALQVFGLSTEELLTRGISQTSLPAFARSSSDQRSLKSWSYAEMPEVGSRVGFLQKPESPLAVAIFVTKGGVLKSSLTLNLARMAALHGLRTCVVGLDMQGDITTALSPEEPADDNTSLKDALVRVNSLRGLANVFSGDANLEDVLQSTDLPTLFYIPETPELVNLDQSLMSRNRREYWLNDQIIAPLKERFDLILMDCSPNWNRLITNALVACDVLISPLECKINNFRNFKAFRALLQEFKHDMRSSFTQIYVPTRLSPSRKLSREIFSWYQEHLVDCTQTALRESVQGEEATAMRVSIPEYAPASDAADEMRELMREIWSAIAEGSRANVGFRTVKSEENELCL